MKTKSNLPLYITFFALVLLNVIQFFHKHKINHQIAPISPTSVIQKRRLNVNAFNKLTAIPQNIAQGWSTIHVYFGKTNELNTSSKYHSQLGQDELIMRILDHKKKGYFIDLAANDARNISNTLALEKELDWDGLCIEPNPMYWYGLSFRKCKTVGALIGKSNDEEVEVDFSRAAFGGRITVPFEHHVLLFILMILSIMPFSCDS